MKISLLTLVKNREEALKNMLKGVALGQHMPDEVVIVHMGEDACQIDPLPFPVTQVKLKSKYSLPLALARNLAVRTAQYENLIFLDVDCIPASNMLSVYMSAFSTKNQLISGRVRYISKQHMLRDDLLSRLYESSTEDPVRENIDNFNYELFWSLNFGCTKSVFSSIGGFDPGYSGYGAEDTDFAFSARERNIPLLTVPAYAFHQYHHSYDPPLNHFNEIVKNAAFFYHKWKVWPMSGWLEKFRQMGLINLGKEHLDILREPLSQEISSALKI